MVLTISCLYTEPDVVFKISPGVDNLVRDTLIQMIMKPYGLEKKDPELFLGLFVTTRRDCRTARAMGPDHDKRNEYITWALRLPFEEITRADDPLEPYLNHLFSAVAEVFANYGVSREDVSKVESTVKMEVLGNPRYSYIEDQLPDLDVSDLL
jgi:hypothetical protein